MTTAMKKRRADRNVATHRSACPMARCYSKSAQRGMAVLTSKGAKAKPRRTAGTAGRVMGRDPHLQGRVRR